MKLSKGQRLGTYEIIGSIGSGGMGEVYRAKDLRLGREVAVKILPAEVASNADRLARFEREARAVAGLNHPNIVTLYSVDYEDNVHFLTMELVEGQDLSQLIRPDGLPLGRILDLMIPLADALAAAHDRGVIHRDLKPSNVMVTRDGRMKVLDFGLAKLVETDSIAGADSAATVTSPLSEPGQMLGTVQYMSPEQIRCEALDARTDLFSLGIILYELATGTRPFTGRTLPDISSAILRDNPEPITRIRSDLPADFERLVIWCLEKIPRERIQSALDISNELRRLRKVMERGETDRLPSDKIVSIAVLAFVNRNRDDEDEYFSDGLADELLNMLTKIKGLRVAARSSSFKFKGKNEDISVIGAKLNVATVLDGSVRRVGNRVRISVQLVNVSDGYHLWSETYDRTLDDLLEVQYEIAQSVVMQLRTTLLGVEADSSARGRAKADVAWAAKGRANDPEAYRLYLLARFLNDRMTRDDIAKGIEYLKDATARDPKFALSWAELGRAYVLEANNGWIPYEEGYERARNAVELSLALEPDLAEAHAGKGWIQMIHDWDWRGSEISFERALELAPGNERVLLNAGALALNQGRLDYAMQLFRRAMESAPLSLGSFDNIGVTYYAADRFEEAEEAFLKSLELAPQRAWTHAILSLCMLARGRIEEAVSEAMREPEEAWRLWALAIVHYAAGHRSQSDEFTRELAEKYADSMTVQIAEVHAVRGEADAAFEWLEKSYSLRDGGLVEMKNSRQFLALHSDPRWADLLRKIGFEVQHGNATKPSDG